MKDAYSFDVARRAQQELREDVRGLLPIFDRCGLTYLPVEAENGPIGGDASHEFMIPADNGEDSVLHCKQCGYAANVERPRSGPAAASAEVAMDA